MNINEIRTATKKLLREQIPSQKQYEEALPLCKELWESFSATHELWDAHQYANCLKKLNKLDEAEAVCESVYFDFKDVDLSPEQSRPFLYIKNLFAWIINDKYIKTIRQPNYQFAATVLDKLVLLACLFSIMSIWANNLLIQFTSRVCSVRGGMGIIKSVIYSVFILLIFVPFDF